MLKPKSIVFIAVGLLAFSRLDAAPVAGQPDAGSIMRSQNPQRELPGVLPSKENEKPLARPEGGPEVSVTVKAIHFDGYEGIASRQELQALVAGSVGKTLDWNGLQDIAMRVTTYLRAKGWFLAEAYLPEQDLSSGVVTIAIVQGKSDGGIKVERDDSVRISKNVLEGITHDGAEDGKALNLHRLERAILLTNDLPGMNARAMIQPGSLSGTSAVTFKTSEGPLVSGAAWSDNMGNRYTGAWRGSAMVSLNDPLRYGDRLSVLYTGAEGLTQGKIDYIFPIGCSGLMGDVSWTGMNYRLHKEFEDAGYTGDSSVIDGALSYPLIRTRKTTLKAGIGYAVKLLTDRQNSTGLSDKMLKEGSANLALLHYDNWLGGGATTANVEVNYGDFHEDNAAAAIDAEAAGKTGGFTFLTANLSRLQRVATRTTLNLSWSSQYAFDNLDTSEKFYLGGPYGVRAYPVGEAGGDSGHLLNADLRYQLPVSASWGKMQLGCFYDAGYITLNHERFSGDVSSATGRNSQGSADGTFSGTPALFTVNAPINLPEGYNFGTKLGYGGATVDYYVITKLGEAGSTTGEDLQGMNGNLAGNYVLGANIDASATSDWNGGLGFSPIGNDTDAFTGVFDGLGHTISGLTINRPQDYVGLFGSVGTGGAISNVGLEGGAVTGLYEVGGLVGLNAGTVEQSYATGAVTGNNEVGGLVGVNGTGGTVSESYATGSVNGDSDVGGLVGYNDYGGTVTSSYWDTVTTEKSSSAVAWARRRRRCKP